MNIDFNTFFRLRIDVLKVDVGPEAQYQLKIENINLEDGFTTSSTSYFLNKEQLKSIIDYLNGVYDGIE